MGVIEGAEDVRPGSVEGGSGRGVVPKILRWFESQVGDPMSSQAAGRLAAILFVLCGLLVSAVAALTLPDGADRLGLRAVGALAVATGVVLWLLPWSRWPRSASLWATIPALGLVAAHNYYTGGDGFRYGLFFLVVFAWAGLSHPRGVTFRLAPGMVLAYIIPLRLAPSPSPAALASLAYAVPIAMLIGETAAWVAERWRRSEAAFRASEARWRSLVMNASDLIVVIGPDGIVLDATPAVSRLFGYSVSATIGMQVLDLVHPDDIDFVVTRLARSVADVEPAELIEFRVRRADGSFTWVESIGTNLLAEPTVGGIVCNVRDISERKSSEAELINQASHDALTSLPNRFRLVSEIERCFGAGKPSFALLLMDLDRFKEVNDGLGHSTGDRVLIEVADRLRSMAGPALLVARLGGDEFAVVVADIESVADAALIADRLRHVVDQPIEIDEMTLHVGVSIGIAWADEATDGVSSLMQQADVAMYRAKAHGLGWAVYGPDDEQNRPAQLAMVADLRQALDNSEIRVHFQPQIELATGQTLQVEALARWRRGGVAVPPDEFIPMAEHAGLMKALTESVLRQSLAQCRRWADEGVPVSVAVNISASSLRDPALVDSVRLALVRAGVPAHRLTLEVTESALAELTNTVVGVMHGLRALGVRISIDDFGTGYSSMAYLKRLPVDELKIDRAFVTDMVADGRDRSITKAIIELAHSLDLTVVGEGVESDELASVLLDLGCDTAQGFGVCRPAPGDDLGAWLASRATLSALAAVPI